MWNRTVAIVIPACLLSLAACGHTPARTASPPPRSATAGVVLNSYLHDLVAGDCAAAHRLAASTFVKGNGELCGDVKVKTFSINTVPAAPRPGEVEYATVLTTAGSADATIPPGKTTWFYELERHDGQWKLASGGSGP